jgi:hypothetical protein
MDVTAYLRTYKLSAHELAMKMILDVLAILLGVPKFEGIRIHAGNCSENCVIDTFSLICLFMITLACLFRFQ